MHTSGHAVGSHRRTTKELQAPTDYSGIYQTWDVDLDEDIEADDPWHFGTSTQYPALARISHQAACRRQKAFGFQDVDRDADDRADCGLRWPRPRGSFGPVYTRARARTCSLNRRPRYALGRRARRKRRAHRTKILRDHHGPWVESTTGAVAGRHDPIYTHSVSSRRSANRTCGFPASGSLRDHAFAHGGSRVGTDGRTWRNGLSGAHRRGRGESPCRPSCASSTTTGGAVRGPERRQLADRRRFRPGAAASWSIHARLSPSLSHVVPWGAPRSLSAFQTRSVNRLSLAPASTVPGPGVLSSAGIARPHRYYDPIRHPKGPAPRLAAQPLASAAPPTTPRASRVAHGPPTHMPSPLPRRNRWVRTSFSFPNGGGLPRISGGSASASPFSRPAQRSLLVTACALAESLADPFTSEASSASLPPRPFRLLPAGTTLAGWDLHPLRPCTFARHTEKCGLALPMPHNVYGALVLGEVVHC